mgnify:CR=1 FL=1
MIDPRMQRLIILRKSELLKEAEVHRLVAQTRARQVGLRGRFLLRVGELMIDLGSKLKDRYAAPLHEANWRQANGKA